MRTSSKYILSQLKKRRKFSLQSYGNSMYPLFCHGDIVIVKPISKNKLKVDDVITVEQKTHFITHRVVYIDSKKGQIITKGDNNSYPDKKINPDKIVGKVVKIRRKNKTFDLEDFYLFQSTLYLKEIMWLIKAFSQFHIDYVFLKGLPLHLYYNNSHPKRGYGDCDVLINPIYNQKVKTIFKSMGYQIENFSPTHMYHNDVESQDEYTYSKEVGMFKIMFDIHLRTSFITSKLGSTDVLYPQKLLDSFSQKMLKEKRIVKIFEHSFPILSKENLVIYLALHLYHHNFRGYSRYLMLDNVINNENLDFNIMLKTVYQYNVKNFIYPVFGLLMKYYNPNLNSSFLTKVLPDLSLLPFLDKLINKTNIFENENVIDVIISKYYLAYRLTSATFLNRIRLYLFFIIKAILTLRTSFLIRILGYLVKWKLFIKS